MRGYDGNDWTEYVDNTSGERQKAKGCHQGSTDLIQLEISTRAGRGSLSNRSQRKYRLKPINCRKTKIKMIGERNACICIVRSPLNWANDTSPRGMIHYHMEKTLPAIKDGGKSLNSRIYLQKLKKNILVESWQRHLKIPTGLTNVDMEGRNKSMLKYVISCPQARVKVESVKI